MLPSIATSKLHDRDDRSLEEIADLRAAGTRVLRRRDLESYLWDDEVIAALCLKHANTAAAAAILAEKGRLMGLLQSQDKPVDDVKAISGGLFNFTRNTLGLTGCGNTALEFARATLAPLVVPGTNTYAELESAIF